MEALTCSVTCTHINKDLWFPVFLQQCEASSRLAYLTSVMFDFIKQTQTTCEDPIRAPFVVWCRRQI